MPSSPLRLDDLIVIFDCLNLATAAELVRIQLLPGTEPSESAQSQLEVAGKQALARIASPAAHVMGTLGHSGRGKYDSENGLRQWLNDDGVAFTTADLSPAMACCKAPGRVEASSPWTLPQ